ncbi:Sorting nexin, cytoplasm-to-vacuole targeting pathway/endosomal sorting [Spiromyces aspiralis]|uniref:Sorting nexin, cytoplasm-to-vacuole targeting pathway/endosomal sorting n=1 Tax=Spiromyces aspiralis TaxID=68401 RepID=A0ACC1HVE5_9FUNG|nr:Sorting nexin, cytoplasm-to-vacuole targeting pathway/endosomal sorting [Spiromyces aspiralis]
MLRNENLEQEWRHNEHAIIQIRGAEKKVEGSSYIAYIIQFGDREVERRYSEFESLRKVLVRLYPTIIVAVIPEKHSITHYVSMRSRVKEDQYIIEQRKRMLQTFLNRLIRHPILGREHIVHRFLESGEAWKEVLHSPLITNLPHDPLHSSPSKAIPSSVADSGVTGTHPPKIAATNSYASSVPIPSSLTPLRNPDSRWVECELFTNKFATEFSANIEANERRVFEQLSKLATSYIDLGAVLNGLSLLESGELEVAIEKTGQVVDSSFGETNRLIERLQSMVSEPIHEYAMLSEVIKRVLRYRSIKNIQLEQVQYKCAHKRDKLDALLKADLDSQRLAQALSAPTTEQQSMMDGSSDGGGGAIIAGGSPNSHYNGDGDLGGRESAAPGGRGHGNNFDREVFGRRQSGLANSFGSGLVERDDFSDDPLAQFQAEESAIWGGGAGSTIPRLFDPYKGGEGSAPRREPLSPLAFSDHDSSGGEEQQHQQQQQQEEQQQDLASDNMEEADGGVRNPRMTRSAYIVRPSGLEPRLSLDSTVSHDVPSSTASQMSKSTSALPGPQRQQQHHHQSPSEPPTSRALTSRMLSSPKTLGSELINRLAYAFNGMMDADPEQLRRNQIGKLTSRIAELEEQAEMLQNDLVLINSSIQDNLDRYQRDKVRDFKNILLDMARMHIEWCEENAKLWESAKEAIDRIPEERSLDYLI